MSESYVSKVPLGTCLKQVALFNARPLYNVNLKRNKQENKKMKKNNEKGFSLVELLVVVIIIAIVAAIAIPNLLASRRAANEASAISSLRTIHSANVHVFLDKWQQPALWKPCRVERCRPD